MCHACAVATVPWLSLSTRRIVCRIRGLSLLPTPQECRTQPQQDFIDKGNRIRDEDIQDEQYGGNGEQGRKVELGEVGIKGAMISLCMDAAWPYDLNRGCSQLVSRCIFLGLDRFEGQAVMTAFPAGQKSERLDSTFSDAHLVTFAHARLIALIEGGVLPVVVADGNLPTCLLR